MTTTTELNHQDAKSQLPDGWQRKKLAEVCSAIRGVTFPSGAASALEFEDSVACLTTSGVQEQAAWDSRRFIHEQFISSEEQILRTGDILVSTANSKELVGKSCLISDLPFKCTFGAFVTVLRPNACIHPEFFHFVLRKKETLEFCFTSSSNTTGISNLRVNDLLDFEIPLPPLAEQKRIAGILKEQMAAVERARANAEAQLQAAEAFARRATSAPSSPAPKRNRGRKKG